MSRKVLELVGWLGTALMLAGVAIRFLRPEWEQVWRGLIYGGLATIAVYGAGHWREVVGFFSRRQARYGTLSTVSVLIMLGILSAINYIAIRQNKRWDFTAAQQFSVSEQTRKVLGSLEAPVVFRVFDREDQFDRFRNRLDEYAYISDKVSVEYIDPDRQPAMARQYQVQAYGTVVVEYQGRIERVTSDGEQELTNTLIKTVEGKEKKAYFVQGHGEKSIESSERDGYSQIVDALKNENFGVENLVLAQQADVPEDASVLVIAGPRSDLLAPEIAAVERYMATGGRVLMLLDPPAKPGAPVTPGLAALARSWNIEVGENVVVDVSGMGQLIGTDASVPVAATYPSHPITDRFSLLTAYPFARSVTTITGGTEGRFPQAIIETSARSWAESDVAALGGGSEVTLDEAKGDKRGPVSIAAAVTATVPSGSAPPAGEEAGAAASDTPARETRLVVVGDSDFAANFALGIQGNRDLFLNMVNWLAGQENLIAIRAREPEDRRITLTADQQRRLFWLSVILIPGVILGAGVRSWWRRR